MRLSKVISFAMKENYCCCFFLLVIFWGNIPCTWLPWHYFWTTLGLSVWLRGCPVCAPLQGLLPTPPLTQQQHPFFSFMLFIRQHGLVRCQCVLAPAHTAVFTTQGIWMLTPPICLMRPVISFNSNRSLTPHPQQYEAKIGQVYYACYSM